MKSVDWLAGVFVADAEIQGQIWSDFEVVLHEVVLIVLREEQERITGSNRHGARCVIYDAGLRIELVGTVIVWQERSQLGQVLVLSTKYERVTSLRPVKVIGVLPHLTDTSLR